MTSINSVRAHLYVGINVYIIPSPYVSPPLYLPLTPHIYRLFSSSVPIPDYHRWGIIEFAEKTVFQFRYEW